MSISLYNLKEWYRMLTGRSVLHVNQDIGKSFEVGEIKGYYNNLTEKVTMEPVLLTNEKLPKFEAESGKTVFFPVAIFQYGLGAYDLYLQTSENKYLNKFNQCVEWAMANQEESGAWSNFFFVYKDDPYGAMCQGEGASLLLRAYKETNDEKYLEAAKRAIAFMLKDVKSGGTTYYDGEDVILLEYTHLKPVMNGWIFALWGLYDFNIVSSDEENINIYKKTLNSLIKYLPSFDGKYWSMYDLSGKIASPFYHNLHIAQMQAMYRITGEKTFEHYAEKWEKDSKSKIKKMRAFVKKAIQKIAE